MEKEKVFYESFLNSKKKSKEIEIFNLSDSIDAENKNHRKLMDDSRAISVSGYFHQEKIKISQFAHDKQVQFKGVMKNHLLTQLTSFRIGDKLASKRADDLLDCAVYAMAIGVGNKGGI